MSFAEPLPTDNWFRSLKDDRIEVCLRTNGLRLRASGDEPDIWRLVEQFEAITGREVVGYWKRPPRSGPRQLAGQISVFEEPNDGQD